MIEDESQKEKVISIFRRQCRLPLYELEGTYKEFKAGFQKWPIYLTTIGFRLRDFENLGTTIDNELNDLALNFDV